ncbi:MAG: SprT-like domain-containing protein [Bdellovibrionales bacterium]|jgi:hypothetical protein|nr:SprT-like domain-containing protein [Bdellovibrionales bacterium]
MLIYSKTIIAFIKQAKSMARDILLSEMNLKLKGQRFFYKGYYYPLTIVCFEGDGQLGYFKPHGYEIGINKKLFYHAKDSVLRDILRHELAHFYTYLVYGENIAAHGKEFREICKSFGWGEDVYKEKMDVSKQNEKREGELEKEKVILKVQKLLALSSSSNLHESQLATQKANELLLRYNIERLDMNEEEDICVKRILQAKRNGGKFRAIYEILKSFFVSPVFNHGKSGVYLEIIGKRVNVEMAEFVGLYLDRELENLWNMAKKEKGIKGIRSKNSFYEGIAKGYLEKIEQTQRPQGKALMIINNFLDQDLRVVHPRLGKTSYQGGRDGSSESLGHKWGRKLQIGRPLDSSKKGVSGLLE